MKISKTLSWILGVIIVLLVVALIYWGVVHYQNKKKVVVNRYVPAVIFHTNLNAVPSQFPSNLLLPDTTVSHIDSTDYPDGRILYSVQYTANDPMATVYSEYRDQMGLLQWHQFSSLILPTVDTLGYSSPTGQVTITLIPGTNNTNVSLSYLDTTNFKNKVTIGQ